MLLEDGTTTSIDLTLSRFPAGISQDWTQMSCGSR